MKWYYLVFCTIAISFVAFLVGQFPIPEAFGQFPPNTTNSTISSDSSIQPIDFKTANEQDLLSPVLLAPIEAVGDNVYFAWSSNKTGNFEIFFTSSPDKGKTIQKATNLSNSSTTASLDVSLKAEGDNVYVSWWENYANGSRVPAYIASNDNGRIFGEKVILSQSIK